MYMKISSSKSEFITPKHNPSTIIMTQIPPFLEQYTLFILQSANKQNFNRHLGWLVQSLNIEKDTISEALMVDYIRYLLLVIEDTNFKQNKAQAVHRWLILGWILKFLKSKYYLTLAK